VWYEESSAPAINPHADPATHVEPTPSILRQLKKVVTPTIVRRRENFLFPYSWHSLLDLPFEKLLLHSMQINIYIVDAKIKSVVARLPLIL